MSQIADGIRSPSQRASELVRRLEQLKHGSVLKRYISHIRFPKFKNIAEGAKIDFPFPVTALVGPNGSGKTSALHALYGAPRGQSTSDFWFSTELDPIKEGDGEPNRFIYGYWLEGVNGPVETRKARVKVGRNKRRKPGYFEPTKATKGDGMDLTPFPPQKAIQGQSKDRWNPVDRELVYLNFRSELSGFDKYLYWARPKPTQRYPSKQDRLVASSRQVKRAIDLGRTSHTLWGREALFENRALSTEELSCVCAILDKEYIGARLLRHSYYGGHAELTVIFEKDGARYSEAFAGSGELAVVSLVTRVLAAEKYSLVLLDEPEVSLHPAAQERIAIFLMEVALRNKIQVVFTTHSAPLVKHLPPNAIKVFVERSDGKFDVLSEAPPVAAFQRLGVSLPGRLRVLVEDALAKALVEVALRSLPLPIGQAVDVDFLPGGADAYLSQRIPTLMHEQNPPLILLDGDQDRGRTVPDPDLIPVGLEHTLAETIREVVGCDPVLLPNGGDSTSQRQLERQYLGFLRRRVRYLPYECPEQGVLEALGENPLPSSSPICKERLRARTFSEMGYDDGQTILQFSRVKLNEKRGELSRLDTIADVIKNELASLV